MKETTSRVQGSWLAATRLAGAMMLCLMVLLPASVIRSDDGYVRTGKNPGKVKGRWIEIYDVEKLRGYPGVYLGDIEVDIHWKKEGKDTPVDEELLKDKIREHVLLNLRQLGIFDEVSERRPGDDVEGMVRLDCELLVEPGNRAVRYMVGFGAGKSKSIFEIRLTDHQTREELGLYHGYGTGTGMGLKLAGGGARKMTQDDIQENAKKFAELLQQVL